MISGLRLPYLSEADPALAGEGSLDPVGLASIADRLAEEIVPGVTARMSRIRFITAIAAASAVTDRLVDDVVPADGVTPPYLAFEWHLVEALAKDRTLPQRATAQVPGILKARTAVARGARLEAKTYLKVPKVFGFVGIYKRLARFSGVVDDELLLEERGYRLVREWEREQSLEGFAERKSGTPGGRFATTVESAVRSALLEGRVAISPRAWLWSRLITVLRPDTPGRAERRQLRALLEDAEEPMRRELVQGVARFHDGSERDILRILRRHASSGLRARIDAITSYERVASLLLGAFDAARRVSTARGTVPASIGEVARHPVVHEAAEQLPVAFDAALMKLERLNLAEDFEWALERFRPPMPAEQLVEELLAHHEHIQAAKPPGKRPWFDRDSRGVLVRLGYEVREEPSIPTEFIHPYRIGAVRSLLSDLA